MCGFAGYVGVPIPGHGEEVFGELYRAFMALQGRASDGWGLFSSPPLMIIKSLSTPKVSDLAEEWRAAWKRSSCVCGYHLHAGTGGMRAEIEHLHPIAKYGFCLLHNGIIVDPKPEEGQTDTQMLLEEIEDERHCGRTTAEAVLRTMSNTQGQYACAMWDETEGDLYLWRNFAPLYFKGVVSCRCLLFSGAPFLRDGESLPPGELVRWRIKDSQLCNVGRFPVENIPYNPEEV